MRTLLDLIQEFATLNEAKTLSKGVLPPDEERRWAELKHFYDLLMAQDGLAERPVARFSAAEIREKIRARSRLRVRTELEIVVMAEGEVHHARVGNLSCGGVLLLCDHGYEVGAVLTLQLASFIRGAALLPTKGTVVWRSEARSSNGTFRFHLGVEFVDVAEAAFRSLDTLVVDSIETKLLSLRPEVLDSEFVARERLALG